MSRFCVLFVVLVCVGCGQSDIERRIGELEKRQTESEALAKSHHSAIKAHESYIERDHQEKMDKIRAEIRKTEEETRRLQGQ